MPLPEAGSRLSLWLSLFSNHCRLSISIRTYHRPPWNLTRVLTSKSDTYTCWG